MQKPVKSPPDKTQEYDHREMIILALNAGSSSLKYRLYRMPAAEILAQGAIDRIGTEDSSFFRQRHGKTENIPVKIGRYEEGIAFIAKQLTDSSQDAIRELDQIGAVGHRVVHGGKEFSGPVVIDDKVVASLEQLADLAPLHNFPGTDCIRAARKALPDVPHVACFDTVFYAAMPAKAHTYGLPLDICDRYGIRRYGFHGLSHQYARDRTAVLLGKSTNDLSAITCHLGNGCSITAIKNGRPIDTSMGFTPLEGLIMGTRCGDIDPAIVLYLMNKGYDYSQLNTILNGQSGLLGISGISNDARTLLEAATAGHSRAKLAIDVFSYRLKKYIGAYTAILPDLDALVFTGGIGENSAEIRSSACRDLSHIGIELDQTRNEETVSKEGFVGNKNGRAKVLVVSADEEAVIAEETFKAGGR